MRKIFTLLLLSISFVVSAQWNSNVAVNLETAGINAADQQVINTSDGKTWIAFYNNNAGNYEMRAQLLDVNGNKLLGTDGVLVCNQTSGSATYVFNICLDASNNLVIAFQYQVSGVNTAFITKVNTNGSLPWGANGIQLGAGLSPYPGLLTSGDIVVAWNNSSPATLYMQKITTAGVTSWGSPVSVLVGTTNTTRGQVVPAADGSFTLVFQKKGVGVSSTLYAQRYTPDGTAIWAAPVQINTLTSSSTRYYSVSADADTVYVGSYVSSGSRFFSYVQRINPDGTLPWGANGTAFADYSSGSDPYQMATNIHHTPGSAYVWGVSTYSNTAQSQYGVYVQKFAKTGGAKLLGNYGKEVFAISANNDQQTGSLALVNDQPVFMSYDVNYKIYATRVDDNGNFIWPGSRIELSSTTATLAVPKGRFGFTRMVNNQAVATWYENRGTEYRSYVQNISASGITGPLPVTMSQLSGSANRQFNILNWQTFTESNNKGFTVERSVNGTEFVQVGFVATSAIGGNSNTTVKYSYVDNELSAFAYFYRLKQVDNDGKFVYSNTIFLKNEVKTVDIISIYPNPVKTILNISLRSTANLKAEIIIADKTGRIVMQYSQVIQQGKNILSADVRSLAKGIYTLQVKTSEGLLTRKLLKD